MIYKRVDIIGDIEVLVAAPAMKIVSGDFHVNAYYGLFFKLKNNNDQAAEVAINYTYVNTICTIEAGESVFLDYSNPVLSFLNNNGMGYPLQTSVNFNFDIQVGATSQSGTVTLQCANYDNVTVVDEQLPPTRLRVLDGTTISFGWINRHGGTDDVITKLKNGQTSTSQLGLMNTATIQQAAVKLNAFFVNTAQINVEHVSDCNNVLQLQWLSKRDGVHKSYAFDIVSINTTPSDKLTIYEQGLSKQLLKEKKVYTLRLTEATFADYQYICDLNYSNDINAYILTNASSGSWEAIQRVFLTSAIGAFKPNEKRNIEFAVEVESEVAQW